MRTTAERVERATLGELRDVHIDDVYIQMDYLLQSRPSPLDLYNRWENQNWSTQKLDFSVDRAHWEGMAQGLEGVRTELQQTFTLFFVGEQAVTDTLSPLVHAAPDEPSRIFLSTQLVDEARHTVFFSRFFKEVVGIEGGLPEALASLRDSTVDAFSRDLRRRFGGGYRTSAHQPTRLQSVGREHHRLSPRRRGHAGANGPEVPPRRDSRNGIILLTKRLRTLGLSSRACDEISKRGNLYYENAWNEYEDIHGEEHPRRYFDRLAPTPGLVS